MKFFKYALLASTLIFASCSDDDDNTPEPVNEEEVITTLTVTLESGSDTVVMQYQDLDGDGPDAATVTVSGSLNANTVYDGSIVLLNETESPAENITEEVEEEDDEHQFFYTVGSGVLSSSSLHEAKISVLANKAYFKNFIFIYLKV